MRGVNEVRILGSIGKDPEVKYLQSGAMVANFSVATNEPYKNKNGELIEHTEWHNITAFGKTAEICSDFLQKGTLVYISGKIRTDKYERDGVTKYYTKIIADQVKGLRNTRASSEESPRRGGIAGQPSMWNESYGPPPTSSMPEDQDIPF
jgi:single-strand DNA-binding protein